MVHSFAVLASEFFLTGLRERTLPNLRELVPHHGRGGRRTGVPHPTLACSPHPRKMTMCDCKYQGLRAATLRVCERNPHKEPGVGEVTLQMGHKQWKPQGRDG